MKRHRIQPSTNRGAVWIRFRRRNKPPPHRVLLDISNAVHELLFRRNLTFIEAAHPNVVLALQTEGESAFDELHCLFQRNIWSRRNQCMEMVWHKNERMQKKPTLSAIVENSLLQQFRRGRHLKKAAAFGRS